MNSKKPLNFNQNHCGKHYFPNIKYSLCILDVKPTLQMTPTIFGSPGFLRSMQSMKAIIGFFFIFLKRVLSKKWKGITYYFEWIPSTVFLLFIRSCSEMGAVNTILPYRDEEKLKFERFVNYLFTHNAEETCS